MTKTEALKSCVLFKNTADGFINDILTDTRTEWKTVEAGETIFSENSGSQPVLCVLASGSLLVFREHNGARVLLNEIKAPGVVGAASLFGGEYMYNTTVQAKKRCQILLLQQNLMNELVRENGDFAVNYIAFLSDKIRFLNKRIASFTSGSAMSRLAGYLLSREENGTCSVSRTKLASELDIGRASLYRAIDTLAQSSAISTDGKSIIILDRDKLLSLSREA